MPIRSDYSGICNHCKKLKGYIAQSGRAEGLCGVCDKKLHWRPRPRECLRCKRMLQHQAKGLCRGCYNSVYHIDKVRMHNTKKQFGIDMELYNKLTKECLVCGFDKVIDLHHLDHNRNNNSSENLVGLCPNHHKMIHHRDHQQEVFTRLKSLGYSTPKVHKPDDFYKNLVAKTSAQQHKLSARDKSSVN